MDINLILGALTFELGVEPVVGVWEDATLIAASQHLEVVDLDGAAP